VRLYFDSSAIVKLIRPEAESTHLRKYIGQHAADDLVTSALAHVEVLRAALGAEAEHVERARTEIAQFNQLVLDQPVLEDAATLTPNTLVRSLAAIHLASARQMGAELRAVVTYDQRMAEAAAELGLPVMSPGACRGFRAGASR
jgi:uncharacterized protein